MNTPKFTPFKDILKALYKSKPANRKLLLSQINAKVLHSIVEIVYNLRKGIINTTEKERNVLRKWKSEIATLAKKKVNLQTKRDILLKHPNLIRLILKPLFNILE
jgi:hypothetical protein